MYLFKKAKDSIVNSLQYDNSSPLVKLNFVCKCILKYTFILSFIFIVLILLTLYLEKNLINKNILQLFAILSLILCLLSFIILKRKNGSHILSKIKMYPFSFKDLIDVSLSTGTLTISILDIFLCYIYLLAALLIFLTAIFSVYESLENPYMKDNENINSFTLQFVSVSFIGLHTISQITIFRTIPYHPLEYLGYIIKNIGDDIFSVIKNLWNFIS
ncbi:conserved Plasmodium membrane protein, unknown function [Plasmodium relictum]|uniref:Uncharacterized protein n=1 Tax=Plasmodium relictum TaxID=85471 RepID=A0A1J1H6H1_PLARL|nr:conserved Plasmodium membrane protein, unknown function [Plasmodium relictum]CRH00520.1 conserved Plasmodium membrane protein, unknown function [Plasmodium relictum]